MAVVLKGAIRLYYYLNEEIADPRTNQWFLIRTPWLGLTILAVFLLAVFEWLPQHMRNKPPYNLRIIIGVFNVVQIISCSYIVYQSLTLGWLSHYSLVCHPVDKGPNGELYAWRVCYLYFIIKFLDLLDTVFFILRKKQNQVTFLHVYHHVGMVAVAWGTVKWVPGGHMTFLLPLNSFVHMIMYSYYLLTVWDESYKQSVWWKKHVTQIQIIQFSIMFVHYLCLALARDCDYPRQPAYIMIPQNLFMVILFVDFYYRTYVKNMKKQV